MADTLLYAIVPERDLTEEILNVARVSVNVRGGVLQNSLKKSTDGDVLVPFLCEIGLNSVIRNYRWYTKNQIKRELRESRWDGSG